MTNLDLRYASLALAFSLLTMPACDGSQPSPQSKETARSNATRITDPSLDDVETLARDNAAFGLALFAKVKGIDQNALVSPHSISTALAMTYVGAKGRTASQMAAALQFGLPIDRLNPAFDGLDLTLASRSTDDTKDEAGMPLSLRIVNTTWAQTGYSFQPTYLDTLAQYYGAGVNLLDFMAAPEASRLTINSWVADQTEDKVKDLIPPGAIEGSTRFVLTNAVYFRAAWQTPFDPRQTLDATFTQADGTARAVPTMHFSGVAAYSEQPDYKAVELAFKGGKLSFVAVLPAGALGAFENALDGAKLQSIIGGLVTANVRLAIPKFKLSWGTTSLVPALKDLGMTDAFEPAPVADFTGIHAPSELSITDVLHKTFIDVNEQGTEAAAATAVIVGPASVPVDVKEVNLERPFLFLIVDKPTGTVLFLGHVMTL